MRRVDSEGIEPGVCVSLDSADFQTAGIGARAPFGPAHVELDLLVVSHQPPGKPVQELRRHAPLPVTLVLLDDLPGIEIKIIGEGQLEHIVPR